MRLRKHAIWRVTLCLAAAVGLAGCVSAPLNVTAMRFDIEPPRQRPFQIASPQINGVEDQVSAAQLTGFVTAALVNRGFQPAASGQPGRMMIDIIFEQEAPRLETRVGTEKIYQWQPEQTVLTTKKTKTGTGLVVTEAIPKRVAARSVSVGSREVNYLVKVYPKRLRIVGRTPVDADSGEVGRPLWAVEVRDDHEVQDLEHCAVQMVAAAMNHLGDDFSGERTIYLSAGDERTKLIRRGSRAAASKTSSRHGTS